MSAFEELSNRINETKEIIEMCRTNYQALGLPSFITDLEESSLNQRLADLERQLTEEVEMQTEEVEVRLETGDLPSGQIPVRTLTIILGGLQALTDSVANTLFNQPSNRGPIPQEILERNSWILRTVKAGSFIAVIDLKHESQISMDEPSQRQVISELYNLFNASDEEESLLEVLSSLGTRTLKYYTEWTKNIRELDSPVEINWIPKYQDSQATKVVIDPEKADKIFTILNERLTSREEEVVLQARLTGINVRTRFFELCEIDGNKIVGKIVKDKVSKSAGYVDKNCRAELLKVITQSSAGKEKVLWTLKDIGDVE